VNASHFVLRPDEDAKNYEDVLAAFPRRPLALVWRRLPIIIPLFCAIAFLVGSAMFTISMSSHLSPLLADTTFGTNGQPVAASGSGWDCRNYRWVFTDCTLYYPGPDQRERSDIAILLLGTHVPDPSDALLRDPNDPGRTTTRYSLTHLTERWVAFVLFNGVWLGLVAYSLWTMYVVTAWRRNRIAAGATPTVVMITGVRRNKRMATWRFNLRIGERLVQGKDTLFAPDMEPLTLDHGNTQALALADRQGRVILLTRDLTNLSLAPDEYQAVLDAIARAQ
jgi:hypothetical protein